MIVSIALLLTAPANDTWFVDATASGPGSGSSTDPYVSITYALAQSTTVAGDTVLVRPGTYEDESVDFLGKDVVVRSTDGAAATEIRGEDDPMIQSAAVRFVNDESAAAVLEGFTIVGGHGEIGVGAIPPGAPAGGCLLCVDASPTLRDLEFRQGPGEAIAGDGALLVGSRATISNCRFADLGQTQNPSFGGGLAAYDSRLLLLDVTFIRCSAGFRGGGAYFEDSNVQVVRGNFVENQMDFASGAGLDAQDSDLRLVECTFEDNRANEVGGAIRVSGGNLVVDSSAFLNNDSGIDSYDGGAIWCDAESIVLKDSAFTGNIGKLGGGAFLRVSDQGLVERCTFEGNIATGMGQFGSGGGAIDAGPGIVVLRSTFVDNTADDAFSNGGGAVRGAVRSINCTFVGNRALPGTPGTIAPTSAGSVTELVNCIVLDNSAIPIGPGASVHHSNVQGGYAGLGNIDLDPLFWSVPNDLGLLPGSPCIDAGDPTTPPDLDGSAADMGAIPFDPFRCASACTGELGSLTCVSNPNSTGTDARLTARGSLDVAADLFVLTVVELPASQFGFFLASRTTAYAPLGGGSQGLLCLGSPILRFDDDILTSGLSGQVAYRPRLASFPQGSAVSPGDTWSFQYWFRDASPNQTSNTSSALTVTF